MKPAILLLHVLAYACNTAALKFVIGPLISSSPSLDVMGVAAQLQARGHSVTVLVPSEAEAWVKMAAARHSSNTTAEAMHYIPVQLGFASEAGATAAATKPNKAGKQQQGLSKYAGRHSLWQSLTMSPRLIASLHDAMAPLCSRVVQDAQVMQQLRALQPDAVLGLGLPVGTIARDSCVCLMADALGDVAAVDVFNGFMAGPVSIPQLGALLTPAQLKTPSGFARNLAVWGLLTALPLALDVRPSNPWLAARRQAGLPPAARGVKRCESVVEVVLGSWLLEYPRALQPHQVLVGPGTPRLARAVASPPAVAEFLAGASAGAVLVAFGSTSVYEGMLTPEDFRQLAQGFARLAPVRVLWALKAAGLPPGLALADLPLGNNTLVESGWVDYNDVLGHPNTRVFVTHGGIHSCYEAAFHGVPVVGLPFIFEQAEQLLKLASRGAAAISSEAPAFRMHNPGQASAHFTADGIATLIQKVMQDPGPAAVAAKMSAALQRYAQQRQPYERAADAVELAVNTWRVQQAMQLRQAEPTASRAAAVAGPAGEGDSDSGKGEL